jgi:hypothetical protein
MRKVHTAVPRPLKQATNGSDGCVSALRAGLLASQSLLQALYSPLLDWTYTLEGKALAIASCRRENDTPIHAYWRAPIRRRHSTPVFNAE